MSDECEILSTDLNDNDQKQMPSSISNSASENDTMHNVSGFTRLKNPPYDITTDQESTRIVSTVVPGMSASRVTN